MSFVETLSPDVKKLVLWWEPAKSGAVLGGATFAYVVFERSGYTILTLCAHIALSSVLALALWTQFAAFVPERAPPATAPKLALSEAQLRDFTEVIVSSVNKFSETLYVVGVSKDKVLILKVLAGLYVTAQIGTFIHLLTLLYIALFVVFLWPLVYKNFQKEIDQAHGEANKQFELHYSRIKERVLDMVSKTAAAPIDTKEE